jgi:hypothetical protein
MVIGITIFLLNFNKAQSVNSSETFPTETTAGTTLVERPAGITNIIINQPPAITNIIIIQQPKPTCQVNYTTCPDLVCCPTVNSCCSGACCGAGSVCIEQVCVIPTPSAIPTAKELSISSAALILAILIPIVVMLVIGMIILFCKYRKNKSPSGIVAVQESRPKVVIGRPEAQSILSPIPPSNSVYTQISDHLADSNASLVSLSSLTVSPSRLYCFEKEERVIGNTCMLFHETTKTCNIGFTNSKLPCNDENCGICRILTKGFESIDLDGITFSSALSAEYPKSINSVLLVCNVVLGKRSLADSSFSQEYKIYNPSQAIPLYLCEIKCSR